ncbi:GNAT family N-acetyltransferase [Rhodoplanes elegans]|uniref:GNAT family N-acetyltransferase n=1 Tax=Rhodoplanes elegans TaxID=29408 RepID=A0A327KJA1_9BRAD|nr:GNAT family N-acetyltransferase [Rhodoplanes elegans]MBK5957473.1 GNAT family N-acetyltransferase [Rhodoplanes elegans]RAI37402.1 GNAT family N-acetyltransferase [Rhodoplanes elegans]
MRQDERVTATRVIDDEGRQRVLAVLQATYQREKRWVADPESQFPSADLARDDLSWFVVDVRSRPIGMRVRPAGVVRVVYDPPVEAYAAYGFAPLDPSLTIEDMIRGSRIAEIGRFAVVPRFRRRLVVAAALMRAAAAETVSRGYTHYLTDVFEDDPHSPYGFHTRVMGFHPVATHEVGELACSSRRITMVLDLKAAYQRLKRRGNWMFRYLTSQWPDALHQRLVA